MTDETPSPITKIVHLLAMKVEAGEDGGHRAHCMPMEYDMAKPDLRTMDADEVNNDIHAFIGFVHTNMQDLCTDLIMTFAAGQKHPLLQAKSTPELYAAIMGSLAEQPNIFLANILTSLLIVSVEAAVEDPEFERVYNQWHQMRLLDATKSNKN